MSRDLGRFSAHECLEFRCNSPATLAFPARIFCSRSEMTRRPACCEPAPGAFNDGTPPVGRRHQGSSASIVTAIGQSGPARDSHLLCFHGHRFHNGFARQTPAQPREPHRSRRQDSHPYGQAMGFRIGNGPGGSSLHGTMADAPYIGPSSAGIDYNRRVGSAFRTRLVPRRAGRRSGTVASAETAIGARPW